jgi:thiol-disulfide isomerase/thioredoxin
MVPSRNTSDIIEEALLEAQNTDKNVFVMFKASWCGLCKKLKRNINSPELEPLFRNNYVFADLVVFESKKNKHLENDGASDLLNQYKGSDSGIPFWVILDKSGKLLANSKLDNTTQVLIGNGPNIGCPITKEEIEGFLFKLRKTSTLKIADLNRIQSKFPEGG